MLQGQSRPSTRLSSMHLTPTLRRLLDQGYEAFAHYRRPTALETSPLRNPEKLLKRLTSKPLRLLEVEDVQEYAAAALTTVGTVDDYKHFLPRLLDLSVDSAVVEPEVIALKLKAADWLAWPQNQTHVVEQIFAEACGHAFRQHPAKHFANKWLVSLAILNVDLNKILIEIETSNNDFCALQLAHLILSELPFASDPFERGYWMEVPDNTLQETRTWLLSQEIRRLLLSVRGRIGSKDVSLLDRALAKHEQLVRHRHQ
ncbi:hypothetical protein NOJ05_24575 [Neorhizobium galegae]|uniref:hypothetical protein n=1 Tax=Neorhizobium galegae TaxID=399 RepID=UPI002104D5D1|nr:hypothetical protein [Neorhizobium galegae]MCQ1780401.1 hypothetical protein [Neorhizobium galegae]MCQ1799117.1 hypothetical protein [Neorhizobium galegae]